LATGIPLEGLQRGPAHFGWPALPATFIFTLGVRHLWVPLFVTRRKRLLKNQELKQFLAVDHSARASMKNAASCEN